MQLTRICNAHSHLFQGVQKVDAPMDITAAKIVKLHPHTTHTEGVEIRTSKGSTMIVTLESWHEYATFLQGQGSLVPGPDLQTLITENLQARRNGRH